MLKTEEQKKKYQLNFNQNKAVMFIIKQSRFEGQKKNPETYKKITT